MTKQYDIAVKTGSYTDTQGMERPTWQTIGTLNHGANGPFLLLFRSFNPAGVPFKPGSKSIICSLFEPKEETEDGTAADEAMAS